MRRAPTGRAALLLVGAIALTACSGGSTGTTDTTQSSPTSASSSASPTGQVLGPSAEGTRAAKVPAGSHLSPADFATAASARGTVLLDVRTPAEFAAGHLPGAVNADVESSDFDAAMADRDEATTYAVYCHSGSRSAVALQQLGDLGFADAYDLAGGITAWAAAGGQVITGP